MSAGWTKSVRSSERRVVALQTLDERPPREGRDGPVALFEHGASRRLIAKQRPAHPEPLRSLPSEDQDDARRRNGRGPDEQPRLRASVDEALEVLGELARRSDGHREPLRRVRRLGNGIERRRRLPQRRQELLRVALQVRGRGRGQAYGARRIRRLDDGVRVRAAEAERADARDAPTPVRLPPLVGRLNAETERVEWDVGVGLLEMQRRRQLAMGHRQRHLDQPGNARGRLQVPDVHVLTDPIRSGCSAALPSARGRRRSRRPRWGIAEHRPGAVRLGMYWTWSCAMPASA